MSEYRVVERRVEVCNGYKCWRERRFGAERRVRFLGLFPIWWPVDNFDWRVSAEDAVRDADQDRALRKPLANPVMLKEAE